MHVASNENSTKATSVLLTLMMVLSSLLLTVSPTVQAVGANQNDLNSGGDLLGQYERWHHQLHFLWKLQRKW